MGNELGPTPGKGLGAVRGPPAGKAPGKGLAINNQCIAATNQLNNAVQATNRDILKLNAKYEPKNPF